MTLHLKNVQNIIIFSMKQFEKDVHMLRAAAGIRQYDMGILCADSQYVDKLKEDLSKNGEESNGVLAFPYNEKSLYWTPGRMPTPKVQYNLGDIILDMPKIYAASKDEYLNIYSMMAMMTTKGISKLTGYGDEEAILRKELDILTKYNQLTGANLELPEHRPETLAQHQAMA